MKLVAFLSLLLMTIACNSSDTPRAVSPPQKVFFDLDGFFKEEINRLESTVVAIEKAATINQQQEKIRVDDFDLTKELTSFIEADINKPAWTDQYRVDSITQAGRLQSIAYTALKDNLQIKQLTVSFDNANRVSQIEIQKDISNIAVQSNQSLTYHTGKGYSIFKEQSLILTEPQKISIDVGYVF